MVQETMNLHRFCAHTLMQIQANNNYNSHIRQIPKIKKSCVQTRSGFEGDYLSRDGFYYNIFSR